MEHVEELKIIYFDGLCVLCNGLVHFIIKRDKHNKLLFASLQGSTGQSMLLQHPSLANIDGIVFTDNGKLCTKSDACLRITKYLCFPWPIFRLFGIIPVFIRDVIYDWVARHRYRLFGKKEVCMIPSKHQFYKFLP